MGVVVLAIAGIVLYSMHISNQAKAQPIRIEKDEELRRRR